MIIVFAAIFILQAVFMDFIKIQLSADQSETALKAALRSTLSGYDLELRKYGLFGMDLDEEGEKQLFGSMIQQNLGPRDQLIKDSQHIQNVYTLANQTVFKRQIYEDMKYKAPIEFTIGAINIFKGKTEDVAKAEDYQKLSEEIKRLMKQRNDALEETWNLYQEMNTRMGRIHSAYTFENIAGPAISGMENMIDKWRKELETELNAWNDIRTQMTKKLDEASDLDHKLTSQITGSNDSNNQIKIYGDLYFNQYKLEIAEDIAFLGSLQSVITNYKMDADSPDMISQANQQTFGHFSNKYGHRNEDELKRQNDNQVLEDKQNKLKKETADTLKKAQDETKIANCQGDTDSLYQSLEGEKGLYSKYAVLNDTSYSGRNDPSLMLQLNTTDFVKTGLNLYGVLLKLIEGVRNELFVDEYALTYFTARTYMKGSNSNEVNADLASHKLAGQELEYLLYGFNSCSANQAAAYSEMFVMRTSIHFVESLTDPKVSAAGTPILGLLVALSESAAKAYEDMKRLLEGEKLAVSDKLIQMKLGYQDYLRLFLLLHSSDQHLMSRMQALIQLNTGIDLTTRATYVLGSMSSSVALWYVNGRRFHHTFSAALSY